MYLIIAKNIFLNYYIIATLIIKFILFLNLSLMLFKFIIFLSVFVSVFIYYFSTNNLYAKCNKFLKEFYFINLLYKI